MAKTKGKYPTSFTTYEEFEQIFNSIPSITGKNRLEWAENLDPELLRIKNKNGRTVAHELADSGTLPEKFFIPSILSVMNSQGETVAGHLLGWIVRSDRWDMLTPEVPATPYSKKLSGAAFLRSKLAQMETKDPERLESALGAMTTETKLALLKGSRRSAAAKKIRGDIDREMESEAFETPPDGEQYLHSEGQEELYCGVRSDR